MGRRQGQTERSEDPGGECAAAPGPEGSVGQDCVHRSGPGRGWAFLSWGCLLSPADVGPWHREDTALGVLQSISPTVPFSSSAGFAYAACECASGHFEQVMSVSCDALPQGVGLFCNITQWAMEGSRAQTACRPRVSVGTLPQALHLIRLSCTSVPSPPSAELPTGPSPGRVHRAQGSRQVSPITEPGAHCQLKGQHRAQ